MERKNNIEKIESSKIVDIIKDIKINLIGFKVRYGFYTRRLQIDKRKFIKIESPFG